MPKVEHQRAVPFAQDVFQTVLVEVFNGIASQEGAHTRFALHLSLRDVGLPDVGYVAVPIHLRCAPEKTDAAQFQMALEIESAMNPGSFPVFKGSCGVNSLSASRSSVWLAGSYTVPLRSFGAFFDATMLHGAAERSLGNFLDDVIAACDARINANEREYLRHHPGNRFGF